LHEHHSYCDLDWILGNDRVHNAVVFMEGFDFETTIAVRGWSGAVATTTTGPRFGGRCISGQATITTHPLPSSYSTLIFGAAFWYDGFNTGTALLTMRAGATVVCTMNVNANQQIQIKNSGGTVIATGPTPLQLQVWNYVEIKCFVNAGTPASGTIEVHLNGVVEIASTAGNFGSSLIDTIGFTGSSGNVTRFDDMYCADTSGAAPRNTFLGDVRIVAIVPTSDGAHTDWTPLSGSHFSNVDEIPPNDDTDYNSDATVGHIDTFGYSDIDTSATVYGVQVHLYARKDDANARQLAPVIRQSGTDNVGTTVTMASTYSYYSQLYNQDPTASDWTPTTVNADEFGVKTIA